MSPHRVRKADGSTEPFRPGKLLSSLKRSGAPAATIDEIMREIGDIHDGVLSTDVIFQKTLGRLKKELPAVASRYSLKRAVFELGPTGFPFEDFVSELVKSLGYTTALRQTVRGACVEHEIDLIAQKDGRRIGAELKFHNSPGLKSDLKVALYVHARFQDIEQAPAELGHRNTLDEKWLITNTKFTSQAIQFGICSGLTLIGWSYPAKGNLQDLVEVSGLHPITCLTTLSNAQKQQLANKGYVICRSVRDQPEVLKEVGVGNKKVTRVLSEIYDLCSS